MFKLVGVLIFFVLVGCQTALAQQSQSGLENQKKDTEQKTKKEIKKVPRRYEFEFGSGLTNSKSKIDPDGLLTFRAKPFLAVGANVLSDSARLDANFQWKWNGFRSKSFKLRVDDNSLKLGKSLVAIGPSVYYFKSDEHVHFIEEEELSADDFTQKDYGLLGVNVRYGYVNKPNIRASYLLGVAYLREHGFFEFKNTNQTVKKLYNRDIQPLDMTSIIISLPHIWRFDLEGEFASLQTRKIINYSNTKKFIPPRHMILNGSV